METWGTNALGALRPWDEVTLPPLRELPAEPRGSGGVQFTQYQRELVQVVRSEPVPYKAICEQAGGAVPNDSFDVLEGVVAPADCTVELRFGGGAIEVLECKAGAAALFHKALLVAAVRNSPFTLHFTPEVAQYELVVGVMPPRIAEAYAGKAFATDIGCRKHALVYHNTIIRRYTGCRNAHCSCLSVLNNCLPTGSPRVLKVGKPVMHYCIPWWHVRVANPVRDLKLLLKEDGSALLLEQTPAPGEPDVQPTFTYWINKKRRRGAERRAAAGCTI